MLVALIAVVCFVAVRYIGSEPERGKNALWLGFCKDTINKAIADLNAEGRLLVATMIQNNKDGNLWKSHGLNTV